MHNMILAYRKVKTELWWMKTVPSLRMLADYERDLLKNLSRFREQLVSGEFYPDDRFLGRVASLPKKVEKNPGRKESMHFRILSDKNLNREKAVSEASGLVCRKMAIPSIEFQILGVLWAMGEGGQWDAERSDACRANQLRRLYVPDDGFENVDALSIPKGPVNRDHPGLYKPYFHAYKKWRNDGLDKAQAAVENGQRIFALTLDLKSYYDCIDARCLRRLHPSGNLITSALYKSLEAWQDEPMGSVQFSMLFISKTQNGVTPDWR